MQFRDRFTTPYEQHAHREGQPFTVVRELTEADGLNPEYGRMYLIRFEDGEEIDAFPEEVESLARVWRFGEQLSIEDLGPLVNCDFCGHPTYDRSKLPDVTCTLPGGFVAGHARCKLDVAGKVYTLCTNCRYDKWGAW